MYQNLITSYCYSAKSVQARYDTAPQPVLKFDVTFNRNDEETTVSSELQIYEVLYDFYMLLP